MRSLFATRYNADVLEENYARWRTDPRSVDGRWSAFFEGFELGNSMATRRGATAGKRRDEETFRAAGRDGVLQTRVDSLVYAYRTLGHTLARLDPLEEGSPEQPLLALAEFGLSERDLDLVVSSKFFQGDRRMPLREMIASLRAIYSGTIGAEFMHIANSRVRNYIRDRIEARPADYGLGADDRRHLLRLLIEAEGFERFLHTRYVGQKRFSMEGGESLMIVLDTIFQGCPRRGVREIVMGMAHRGRLTVLANFLQKTFSMLFTEFSENYIPNLEAGDGDVKYHLGYESVRRTLAGEPVSIRLSPNPSHLEAVDPVVQGRVRARQRIHDDTVDRKRVIPLLVHGDAAFAGQGIVAEVLNLSQLPGYRTGGTIHVIVNNQIGFTTLPADARSSVYATDVAKMIEAPVFHVNGEDPCAVRFVSEIAFDIRQQFARDVVIDMYCYRRHGHNEGDEPIFTQPNLYEKIRARPSLRQVYRARLVEEGSVTEEEAAGWEREFEAGLERARAEVKRVEGEGGEARSSFHGSTAEFQPPYSHAPVETAISPETLGSIARGLSRVPDDFDVVPKIRKMLLERRAEVFERGGPYDWAYGESLAFGSLLLEGVPIRLSGQDSRRGTFSQRHSVLYDARTRERYIPLMNLAPGQGRFCVYDSMLSEAAVLGFDYGYSLDFPSMLCLWEAQFGDFCNGAQVIIDQFIASAESKWQTPSGLVLLLPHGYEGMGPEHSSARVERFLSLCAEENLQVCNLTTPAQYFHALRRQMLRPFRKPLVIFTPKSLLRHPRATSVAAEFTEARFQEVLGAPEACEPGAVRRVILCTGKIYYDLLEYRERQGIMDAALVRVEQIYPLHREMLRERLGAFPEDARLVWCQEESRNMGAWSHLAPELEALGGRRIGYAGREPSASPAVGSLAAHRREQAALVAAAFSI